MNKYSAILIDDEFHSTELLEDIINNHIPDIRITGKFNNPKEAANFISKTCQISSSWILKCRHEWL